MKTKVTVLNDMKTILIIALLFCSIGAKAQKLPQNVRKSVGHLSISGPHPTTIRFDSCDTLITSDANIIVIIIRKGKAKKYIYSSDNNVEIGYIKVWIRK